MTHEEITLGMTVEYKGKFYPVVAKTGDRVWIQMTNWYSEAVDLKDLA